MIHTPLYFSFTQDSGNNYQALKLVKNSKGVVRLFDGNLPGYARTDRSDSKAYKYTPLPPSEFATSEAVTPECLKELVELSKQSDGVKQVLDAAIQESFKVVTAHNSSKVLDDNDACTTFMHADFLRKANDVVPSFPAEMLENMYVRVPGLVYVLPVLDCGQSLEIVGGEGSTSLRAFKESKYFGKSIKEPLKQTPFLEKSVFESTMYGVKALMESHTIPEHSWVMENVVTGPDI